MYTKGMIWYKIGVAMSVLFWLTTGIVGILGDKYNVDIETFFFFYYFWGIWFFLGLFMISLGFWIYKSIRKNDIT